MTVRVKLEEILWNKRMKMADLIKQSDISRTAVQSLYHDKAKGVTFDVLSKLCQALDCKVEDILEYVPDEE